MSEQKIVSLHGDIDAQTMLAQIMELDIANVVVSVTTKDNVTNVYWSEMSFGDACLHDVVQRQGFIPTFLHRMEPIEE